MQEDEDIQLMSYVEISKDDTDDDDIVMDDSERWIDDSERGIWWE